MKFNVNIFTLLFFGSLLLKSNLFSQINSEIKPCGSLNMADKLAGMYAYKNVNQNIEQKNNPVLLPTNHLSSAQLSNASSAIISANFTRISGSMDIFGNLYSNVKPLQYNRWLNVLTFIHRKSNTYSPSSNGNSGTIVAMIGRNNGANWDSTCVWTNTLNVGQVPQGSVYNPLANLSVNGSYIVATGATMSGTNASGSFYASKLTGSVGTNVPGTDEQFFSNTSTFSTSTSPLMTKHDYPQFGFTATDDGMVRTAGMIYNDANGSTDAAKGIRGAHISKGSFNAGAMVWTADSLIPPTLIKTDGSKQIWSQPYMAWNSAGDVGYLVMIGSRQAATGSNIGWQPIIYKTTNAGSSWVLIPGIDFNTANYGMVLNSMSAINTNSLSKVPFFNPFEGMDLYVDYDRRLHIATTIQGTAKSHVDSLTYIHQYTVSGQPTEKYSWQYRNTAWPYIFDFAGDGTGTWSLTTIDSVGTESPSNMASMSGFSYNPWANQNQTNPVSSTMRLQISKSQGDGILYTWAESDTNVTIVKWNQFPNIHSRALRICDGSVSTDEYLISSPLAGANPNVKNHAYFHHLSKDMQCGPTTLTQVTYTIPITVSNNAQLDGNLSVNHYFCNAEVTFSFSSGVCGSNFCIPLNIKQNSVEESKFLAFPNPFSSRINLKFNLSQLETVNIEMYNYLGQKISAYNMLAEAGENNYEIKNAEQLKPGVYFIKLKLLHGDAVTKVIKE